MLEALVSAGPTVKIVSSPMPEPEPDQVLIKVHIAAANPKDWKVPEWTGSSSNQGDDGAGIIETLGSGVQGFTPGDRVAGFHQTGAPGGTYGEYALFPAHLTFRIPRDVSFEEAATIPCAAGTAAAGLFETEGGLGLPLPFLPTPEPQPLVIYGASGSVGAFALQLARKAGIHPLIAVAGSGAKAIEYLLDGSKGDVVVDYRQGDEAVTEGIAAALDGRVLRHALDTVAQGASSVSIARAMTRGGGGGGGGGGGVIARTLPPTEGGGGGELPNGVRQFQLSVSTLHSSQKDFGAKMFEFFGRGLREGWLQPRPYEVVRGGLNGVEKALRDLKDGRASAVKYVVRIGETDGLEGMS